MTAANFPGNIRSAPEPAGYTLLTPASHALLVYFLDRLVLASRRQLQAFFTEADAAPQIGEQYQAGDCEPWHVDPDYWKGGTNDL